MLSFLEESLVRRGSGTHFIVVPGILAHSDLHMKPLQPIFESYEDPKISVMSYQGTRFNADHSIKTIMNLIERNLANQRPMVLFASSLGGMLVAGALIELRKTYSVDQLNALISTILVDSPSGGRDLVLGHPMAPAFVNRLAAPLFRLFTPSEKSNIGYGSRLLKMFENAPKDDEIEEGLDKHLVVSDALALGSGHAFTIWYDQVRWILNSRLDLSKLDGLNITYLANVKNNVTVHQPQALVTWGPYVTKIVEVDTPHCAYIQAQPTWHRVITKVLDELNVPRAVR